MDIKSWHRGHRLTLLIAPPGWGKTSLLLQLIPLFERGMVFISPLKALSLEFHDRLVRAGISTLCVRSKGELGEKLHRLSRYQMIILSYEHVTTEFVHYLQSKEQKFFLIFDEFHLLFYWGSSFRPQLWESFYQLAETGHSVLALSATIDENILREVGGTFFTCFQEIQVVGAPRGVYISGVRVPTGKCLAWRIPKRVLGRRRSDYV